MLESSRLEKFQQKLGFQFTLSNSGSTILIFWSFNFSVKTLAMENQVVHLSVDYSSSLEPIFSSNVGAKCTVHEKRVVWDSLLTLLLNIFIVDSWGDFNEILKSSEHLCRSTPDLREMVEFNGRLAECSLLNIPY
ncbi:hypothetical protein ACH5RR_029131 [Cinchona calisaya]|uniref:Uncharacterized protein n=1 Tax=Cinchona calisaya TaxID=153742 RepID=A0ABD2YUC3_9GENT